MGNCCCSNKEGPKLPHLKPKQLERLVRIQALCRTFLAKKRLKETRDMKLKTLFGTLLSYIKHFRIIRSCKCRFTFDEQPGQ